MVVTSGGGGNPWAKEMTIRRRMARIFNKTQEHFPSLRDYNDYLEQVEDMTFNLIEGIDVEAIEAKIARYERENVEQISLSRAKRAEDLAAALQASRMNPGKAEASDSLPWHQWGSRSSRPVCACCCSWRAGSTSTYGYGPPTNWRCIRSSSRGR